jgi:23S rRNA U2552 (ribose-2'-O)-methylase RlmE/FtsJ
MNIFDEYTPIITKIDNNDIKINDYDIELSNNTCFPNISYGFNNYSFKLEENMKKLTNYYKDREKIYHVTYPFEKTIDFKKETNDGVKYITIEEEVNKFINNLDKKAPKLIGRSFLKMWEMILYFDLIPKNDNFTSVHLGENKGAFIQSVATYRTFLGKNKNEYFATQVDNKLTDYYKNIKIFKEKDIFKIKSFIDFAKPADFITADTHFDVKQINLREQEAYNLILAQIITALNLQKDGGNFVLRIYETYTPITIKLIELLKTFYNEVYICKPLSSRASSPEKFIVCTKFNKKKLTTKISKDLMEMVKTVNNNKDFNIINILENNDLSDNILDFYKKNNVSMFEKQYVGMNNVSGFIMLDNHNGIEYNKYLDQQIVASHLWINSFLNTDLFKKINKYAINK